MLVVRKAHFSQCSCWFGRWNTLSSPASCNRIATARSSSASIPDTSYHTRIKNTDNFPRSKANNSLLRIEICNNYKLPGSAKWTTTPRTQGPRDHSLCKCEGMRAQRERRRILVPGSHRQNSGIYYENIQSFLAAPCVVLLPLQPPPPQKKKKKNE